jgi:hypothetical protein
MPTSPRLLALFFVVGATASLAGDDAPRFAGTWAGTLGRSKILTCFNAYGQGEYYDLRHRHPLRLQAEGDDVEQRDARLTAALADGHIRVSEVGGPSFEPTPPTGHWSLHAEGEDALLGEWTDPAGQRVVPLRLSRVATRGASDGECDAAYYAPIAENITITRDTATFEGRTYEQWTTADAVAMAPAADSPGATAIRTASEAWLRDRAVFAFQCEAGRGMVGEPLGASLEPVVWTDTLLVQRDGLPETYCGGAHGNFSTDYVVWDLQRGERIDPWTWITDGEAALRGTEREDGEVEASALSKALEARHPRNLPDDDCRDALAHMTVSAPYPTRDGLVFPNSFFHAMRACGDDIVLPWRDAEPFLSESGRALKRGFSE